jgi:hypothetical protein
MIDWQEALWSIWSYVTEFFSTPERVAATILTISTIGLWLSTRKLWKITGRARPTYRPRRAGLHFRWR